MLISFQALTIAPTSLRRMMRLFLTIPMHHQTFSHSSITMVSPATNYNLKKAVSVHWCATCPSEKAWSKMHGWSLNISMTNIFKSELSTTEWAFSENLSVSLKFIFSFPHLIPAGLSITPSILCILHIQLHSMVVQALHSTKWFSIFAPMFSLMVNSTQPYLEFATMIMHEYYLKIAKLILWQQM